MSLKGLRTPGRCTQLAGYPRSSRVCVSRSGSTWPRGCRTPSPRLQPAGDGMLRSSADLFLLRARGMGCEGAAPQRGRDSICLPRLQCARARRRLFYFYVGNSLAVFDALPKWKESCVAAKHINQHILGERARSIFRRGSTF